MNKLRLTWNIPAACWIVDLLEEDGTPIITGIGLVTGADLIEQYGYLRVGGQLIAQTDQAPDAVPTFENLGGNGHLYFLTP